MNVNKENLENIQQFTQDELDHLAEDMQVSVFVKKKRPKLEQFTFFFQAVNQLILKELSPASCKVLFYFIAHAEYGNYISKQMSWIMDDTNMSRSSVNRAIKQLTELNIVHVLENPQDKRKHDYYLNPTQSWKGTSKERDTYMRKLEQQLGGKQLNLLEQFKANE